MCPVVALAWAEYRLHTTASVVVAFRSRGCLLCIERVLGRLKMQYRVARVHPGLSWWCARYGWI